jgi:hypothetical protein
MLTCERVDEAAANSERAVGDLAWTDANPACHCSRGCASWLREPDFAFENREEVHAQDRRPPAHVRKRDLDSAKLEQAAEMERQQSAPHAEGGGGAHAGRGRELGMDVAIVLGRRDAGCRVVPTDSRAGLLCTGLPPACYLSSSRRSSTLARHGTDYLLELKSLK